MNDDRFCASRERVAEVLRESLRDSGLKAAVQEPLRTQYIDKWGETLAAALLAAGVFRDEAEVKAEALEKAAEQIVIPGASSLATASLQGRASRLRGESNG